MAGGTIAPDVRSEDSRNLSARLVGEGWALTSAFRLHVAVLGSGAPERVAYVASKTSLIGLRCGLGVEWAHYNINVNVLSPGYFTSEAVLQLAYRVGSTWRRTSGARRWDAWAAWLA